MEWLGERGARTCNSLHILGSRVLSGEGGRQVKNRLFIRYFGASLGAAFGRLLATQNQLGDGRQLHVRGPFIDLANLGVAPVLLDWIVLGESVSPVDLDGQ